MDYTPQVTECCHVEGGRIELVEWHWPDIIDFVRTEDDLMLEMSLPPMATDASACFPDIAPDKRCFMGTLFVRHPHIKVAGRSEGGQIRVVRCVIDADEAREIMGESAPTLGFLQGLLNIRSEALRSLMRLAHRELTKPVDRSQEAMEAIFSLVRIEMHRLFDRAQEAEICSRLAPWQFRRIRERIEDGSSPPSVAELAHICGISPRHLHRQFLALTGKTVSAYVESCRVEQAKNLLAEPEMPVKQVAEKCGFDHPNSFARAFRRATGLSPREFRQRSASGAGPSVDMRRKGVA